MKYGIPKPDFEEMYKLTPHFMCRYYKDNAPRKRNLRPPEENKVKGVLSKKARGRIRTAVNFMCYMSKVKSVFSKDLGKRFRFRVALITLTLSSDQIHSDRVIKSRLLQPLLRILRLKYQVINYVWKAECQKNGNIHFHITIDQFIHHAALREHWNTIQETLGYVTRSGIINPNSTDIHSVKNVKNLSGYICNYIAKKETGRREIDGKIWDCNTILKKLNVTVKADKIIAIDKEIALAEGGKRIYSNFSEVIFFSKGGVYNCPTVCEKINDEIADKYQNL